MVDQKTPHGLHLRLFFSRHFKILVIATTAFSTFRHTGAASSFHGTVLMGWVAHLHLVEILRRYHFACFYNDFHDLSSYQQLHYTFDSRRNYKRRISWVLSIQRHSAGVLLGLGNHNF